PNLPARDLAATVSNALARRKGLGDVQVRVAGGEVRLSGTVKSKSDQAAAVKLAKKAAPGWSVVDELVVKP
ncbi:MAG: BON domain-containing protein, partial [Terriglobales bacterium]